MPLDQIKRLIKLFFRQRSLRVRKNGMAVMMRKLIAAAAVAAAFSTPALAREPVTIWFWGAPPNLQEAFTKVLIEPFNASQDKYELQIEFRNTVENDVRVAVLAGEGPDLVYTSGPPYIAPFAKAGKLEPLYAYAKKLASGQRPFKPVLDSWPQLRHVYYVPP